MGIQVDMGGDDIYCNNIYTGVTGLAGSTTATGVALLPRFERFQDNQNQQTAANWAVSHTLFLNDNTGSTFKVVGASVVFTTAGGAAAAVTVEVATGTQAIGAGTAQLTAPMVLTGAANTVVNGTVIASPTTITAGARINLIFSGTVTALAGATVIVTIQRVS